MPAIVDLTDLDAPFQSNVSSDTPRYFKYRIQDASDLEDLMILLNVSQKSKVQLFLHWTNYPSANKDEHDICLGNAPTEALKMMLSSERKLDMFLEESPFKYEP